MNYFTKEEGQLNCPISSDIMINPFCWTNLFGQQEPCSTLWLAFRTITREAAVADEKEIESNGANQTKE